MGTLLIIAKEPTFNIQQPELLNAYTADRAVIGLLLALSLSSSIGHEFNLQNIKQHTSMKNIMQRKCGK